MRRRIAVAVLEDRRVLLVELARRARDDRHLVGAVGADDSADNAADTKQSRHALVASLYVFAGENPDVLGKQRWRGKYS